ncbi:hypothetical protein RB614_03800 [Phytohabitans sp. ZYX-F-186]|uniref:Uncharacterized protein n=1 Tax=Phytohabitans maris TaxID=3071409 RepID=A0ABU0Z9H7_9ACTN|nr:hypothetical protein [Phytohabitans sp. ZYX-F-186]MDQ7903638.1 hypothetical protein [Phytohabitans sp. ZYX-F-186]
MTDERLAHDVDRVLRRAGLPARTFGDGDPGGFGVRAVEDGVLVTWTPAEELLADAAEAMLADPTAPAVWHLGRVTGVMRQAMIDILRSAGLDAEAVEEEFGPGDLKVLGRSAPPARPA